MSNPYIEAQREWDERFAFHARQARLAFIMAGALAVLSLVMVAVVVWQATHRTYIPYVVAVDALGRAELATTPKAIGDWPPAVVRREVADMVADMRAIPGDPTVLEDNMRRLLLFTLPGTAGNRKIRERGLSGTESPFVLQDQITVRVEIKAVNFQSGTTWLVEWSETTRERGTGALVGVNQYQGTFQLGQVQQLSPEILAINPLGIYLADYDIQLLGAQ